MTEVEKLKARIADLESTLIEVLEVLEPLIDVVDGDEGRQLPNPEAQMYHYIEVTLGMKPY